MNQTEWIDCVVDNDYEININYPHQIRRKKNKRIVSESVDKTTGYIRTILNNKKYYKHRIIGFQFIENDDPENKIQIDHINHIKTDNRIENLRWCSISENQINKSKFKGNFEFVDEISEDAIIVDTYNNHNFQNIYYWDNIFYFYNGIKYRKFKTCYDTKNLAYICARDINNKNVKIYYTKFKRQYDII